MDAQTTEPSGSQTIEDRIAAALAEQTGIDMPDTRAPSEIPEGETVLGTATPAIQHVFALLYEIGSKTRAAHKALQDAEGAESESAVATYGQLKSDRQTVEAALLKLLNEAFNPELKPMAYTILSDWRISGAEDQSAGMPDFVKALLGGLPPGAKVMSGNEIPEEIRALMGDGDMQMLDGGNGIMIGVGLGPSREEVPSGFGLSALLQKLRLRKKPDGDGPRDGSFFPDVFEEMFSDEAIRERRKSLLGKAVSSAIMRTLTTRGSDGETALETIERTMARIEAEGRPMDAEFDIRIKASVGVRPRTSSDDEDSDEGHTEVGVELEITASANPAGGSSEAESEPSDDDDTDGQTVT